MDRQFLRYRIPAAGPFRFALVISSIAALLSLAACDPNPGSSGSTQLLTVSATATGRAITVKWDAPAEDTEIREYSVRIKDANGGYANFTDRFGQQVNDATVTKGSDANGKFTYTASNLENGSYTAEVSILYTSGGSPEKNSSPAADPARVSSPASAPAAPTLKDVATSAMNVEGNDAQAKLTVKLAWDPPDDPGKNNSGDGGSIVKYTVIWHDGSKYQSTEVNRPQGTAAPPAEGEVGNLDPTKTYNFQVFATNDGGMIGAASALKSTPVLSGDKEIKTFVLEKSKNGGLKITRNGVIDKAKKTIAAEVWENADRSKLKPTITFSEHAVVSPADGAETDFTGPVTYTVRARNGSTQAYQVTVGIDPIKSAFKDDPALKPHNDKFSSGDFDNNRLITVTGLEKYAGQTIKRKVSVAEGENVKHAGTLEDFNVAADGSASFGISGMSYNAWAVLTYDEPITITAALFGSDGTTAIGIPQVFNPKKTAGGAIYTWRDLQNIKYQLAGAYKLEDDITFPDKDTQGFKSFEPLGKTGTSFTGTLDGRGKKITGLYVNHVHEDEDGRWLDDAGLFGAVTSRNQSDVVIKDLTLVNPEVIGEERVGTLVGYLANGTVSNVSATSATGIMATSETHLQLPPGGHGSLGGLVGSNNGVVRGHASGAVKGSAAGNVGGLVGYNGHDGTVQGTASGSVRGKRYVGGLVGGNDGKVYGSASGPVAGSHAIGGLVGLTYKGTVVGIASGKVTGTDAGSLTKGMAGSTEDDRDKFTMYGYWDLASTEQSSSGYTGDTVVGISSIANVVRSETGGNVTFKDNNGSADTGDDKTVFDNAEFLKYFTLPGESGKWPTLKPGTAN